MKAGTAMSNKPGNVVKPVNHAKARARADAAKASLEKKYGKMKKVRIVISWRNYTCDISSLRT